MPKYKTHLAGGLITFFITTIAGQQLNFFKTLSWQQSFFALIFCLFGSLFPDVDIKSKIQKVLYFFLFPAIFIAIFLQHWDLFTLFCLIALTPLFINHRGITHRTWFIVLLPFTTFILIFGFQTKLSKIATIYCFFFIFGAISHLILDFGLKKVLFGHRNSNK